MPINPNILLQGRIADIGQATGEAFDAYNQSRKNVLLEQEQALNKQKTEQEMATKQYEADLLRAGVTASRIKPFIEAKDYAGFRKELDRSGLAQEDIDALDTYARADRWQQLGGVADQYIQTARDAGVFQRDYAAAGASGYTPSAVQLFEYRKRLVESGASDEEISRFDNVVSKLQFLPSGGGTYTGVSPITARPQEVDFTGGAGAGAGAGGQLPSEVNVPPPTGRADARVLNQPVPRSEKSNADIIAERNARLRGAETLAERETIRMEEYQSTVDLQESLTDSISAAFSDVEMGNLFRDLPEGKLSSAVNNAVSTFIGGTTGKDAEARMNQLAGMIVQSVGFAPGSQSDAEMKARERLIGDLQDPNISVKGKERAINTYFTFLDKKSQSSREKIYDYYERNPQIVPPSRFRPPAAQTGGGMTQPTGGVSPGQFKVRRIQ